jgi:hypothetical protein
MHLNKLTWERAVSLAVAVARIYGRKQRVFRHPVHGWTWGDADGG